MCWKLCRRFVKFNQKQPHIYEKFNELAESMAKRRPYYSATNIWCTMRYWMDFEYTDPDFKINDHLTPYMARWWLKHHPERDGSDGSKPFFELRRLKNGGEEFEDPDSFPDDESLWTRPPMPLQGQLPFPDDDDDPEPTTEWLA